MRIKKIEKRRRDISFLHNVHTGFEAHIASYKMGTWVCFPGLKRQGLEADHSSASNAEVKNTETVSPFPHTPLWRGA
jgi:hypothetical protein